MFDKSQHIALPIQAKVFAWRVQAGLRIDSREGDDKIEFKRHNPIMVRTQCLVRDLH